MNLNRYIQGIRKGREINRLERKAMDDPFLSDALDGYNKVNNLYADQIREMQEKISLQTHRKSHAFRNWGIAASILVIIGFGGYFLFDSYFSWKKSLSVENIAQTTAEIATVEKVDSAIIPVDTLPTETRIFTPPAKKEEVASVADTQPKKVYMPEIIQAEAVNITIESPISVDTIKEILTTTKEKASTTPEPVIGNKAYKNYLKKSLVRPTDEGCSNAKGKVELSFYINEAGRPTKINIRKSLCQSADAEAIRLVKEGSDWTVGDEAITLDVLF